MQMSIHENIRAFRKEMKLTQEQLAEMLDVTVSAVSKWESGQSVPDIGMMMRMATMFEVSLDALVGYEREDDRIDQLLSDVIESLDEEHLAQAAEKAERLLRRYPNRFDVVYRSAQIYVMMSAGEARKRALERAAQLYERALVLVDQNREDQVNEWTIRNDIAQIMLAQGNREEALDALKRNNPNGWNNGRIGVTLTDINGREEEGLKYLTHALASHVGGLYDVACGYIRAYTARGELRQALEMAQWMSELLRDVQSEKVSCWTRLEAAMHMQCARICVDMEDVEQACKALMQARDAARRFDADPQFACNNMRFFHAGNIMMYDGPMKKSMDTLLPETANDMLRALWEKVKNENDNG